MIIPISSARVIIFPLAISVPYPFFIATPDTTVPMAFKIRKKGIETTFTIKGPIIGIAAMRTPKPTKISVKILITKAVNTIIFLSTPK